jgi:hypothetical protein
MLQGCQLDIVWRNQRPGKTWSSRENKCAYQGCMGISSIQKIQRFVEKFLNHQPEYLLYFGLIYLKFNKLRLEKASV